MKKLTRIRVMGSSFIAAGCLSIGSMVGATGISNTKTGPGSYNSVSYGSYSNSHSNDYNDWLKHKQQWEDWMKNSNDDCDRNGYDWNNQNDWGNQWQKHQAKTSNSGYGSSGSNSGGSSYSNNNGGNDDWNWDDNQWDGEQGGDWSSRSYMSSQTSNNYQVRNDNDIDVDNSNRQMAESGDARVQGNTHGGNATTGDADNYNDTDVSVDVSNSSNAPDWGSSGAGSDWGGISNTVTGPGSYNSVEYRSSNSYRVTNTNNVSVSNSNNQTARSGDATVSGNTYGGDAHSGSASNHNSSRFDISVDNS